MSDETATFLMDRPVGGWSHLVTNESLDLRLRAVEARFDVMEHRFEQRWAELSASVDRRLRVQTWTTTSAIVAMAGAIVASAAL